MRLVELSRSEHRELRIRGDRVEACAASQHLIPIVVGEFRKAATQYPIVFAKHPETGRFAPYVLSGLGVAENLFWSGTELDVSYVPLNVRRQPFYVGMDDAPDASAGNVLCIDLDHPCVDSAGARSIVNADGTDSAYLKEILAILGELVAGKTATEQFIAALLSLDLLAPIVLDIVLDDATPLQVQGLYGLDEEKFRQLDATQIDSLWRSGHLDLIYAVMIASGQIFKLIRLKNQRIALSRAWQGNAR
ncbi:peptidase [Steroidobacter agaridevorans]|uniref:Peptidase n=1 Tax=Steroidobacter agaridevorans TaxID=2695856 RepID=A0A829YFV3_9GAMM|nr:SapC family protein [Steroidobacter agaridevorans]GFE82100.1 peptidase [Steroidobacter agaridevorans]